MMAATIDVVKHEYFSDVTLPSIKKEILGEIDD